MKSLKIEPKQNRRGEQTIPLQIFPNPYTQSWSPLSWTKSTISYLDLSLDVNETLIRTNQTVSLQKDDSR